MTKSKSKSGKLKGKPVELSKKERKALKAREAELVAKLERKAAKAAARTTPGVESPAHNRGPVNPVESKATEQHTPAAVIEAADKVLADPNASAGATKSAQIAKAKALAGMTDADLKARIADKRAAREALVATADGIDRDDDAAVKAYNDALATMGGGTFLTSTRERNDIDARLKADVEAAQAKAAKAAKAAVKKAGKVGAKVTSIVGESTPIAQALNDEAAHVLDTLIGEHAERQQVVEQVETDHGREFAVGTSVSEDEFAKPSDAPRELEAGGKGYKIIALGADGKPDPRTVRQLTRVTTYIACLEDKTNLEAWKLRTLLEGAALDTFDEGGPRNGDKLSAIADLMHVRDVALAKAAKADRKGKLEVGERARIETAATKAFKDAVNAIATELLELGGVHEKANRGTNLHALTELADAGKPLPDDESVTPTDRASVAAYGAALERAGIKVVASEVVVVDDVARRAGRLDRVVLYRPKGAQRAKRVVADIKTGRIDYGFTKIEQQVAAYADGKAYDLDTGERTPLGADRHLGLLIHVPQGEGTAYVYELDLDRGRRGNKLAGAVREWRTESGRVKVENLTDLAAVTSEAASN